MEPALLLVLLLLLVTPHTAQPSHTIAVPVPSSSRLTPSSVEPTGGFPLVLSTWAQNGYLDANRAAWAALTTSQNIPFPALDALQAGAEHCENVSCDGTVGRGGSPDETGEVTLDAMVMISPSKRQRQVGAVGALRRIPHAFRVARAVMEHTCETLLVGDQATTFALAQGLGPQSNLSTPHSDAQWKKWLADGRAPNYRRGQPGAVCASPMQAPVGHDTLGMIVVDAQGRMACGTTTNGAAFKVPGRVGDGAIAGSGAWCETGVGAAAATGDGDIMMRHLPALKAVQHVERGETPTAACNLALAEIGEYEAAGAWEGALVVANAKGEYAGCAGGRWQGAHFFRFSVHGPQDNDSHVIYPK